MCHSRGEESCESELLGSDRFCLRLLKLLDHIVECSREHADFVVARDGRSLIAFPGGNILGEALDRRLIDKVQIYLGPILTGGPVLAFPGEGAAKTANALRLRDMEYQQIGQTISLSGYPDVPGCE